MKCYREIKHRAASEMYMVTIIFMPWCSCAASGKLWPWVIKECWQIILGESVLLCSENEGIRRTHLVVSMTNKGIHDKTAPLIFFNILQKLGTSSLHIETTKCRPHNSCLGTKKWCWWKYLWLDSILHDRT